MACNHPKEITEQGRYDYCPVCKTQTKRRKPMQPFISEELARKSVATEETLTAAILQGDKFVIKGLEGVVAGYRFNGKTYVTAIDIREEGVHAG